MDGRPNRRNKAAFSNLPSYCGRSLTVQSLSNQKYKLLELKTQNFLRMKPYDGLTSHPGGGENKPSWFILRKPEQAMAVWASLALCCNNMPTVFLQDDI